MTNQAVICNVRVMTSNGKTASGEVTLQHWDQQARMKRALRILGILWGIAVVTVFIPLAHFLLVPGFLIAGPIVAFKVYEQDRAILGGQCICPECGQAVTLVQAKDRWPLSDLCSKCQSALTVEKVSA
jgi:hypothetical protein